VRIALSAEQVRLAEQAAVRAGESLAGLMDRAGTAVAYEASALAPAGRIAVVTGAGNNGGDGWVAARLLRENGREVAVVALGDPSELPTPAREAAAAAIAAGVEWTRPESAAAMVPELGRAALVVDAVLGVGSRGAPRPPLAEALAVLDDVEAPVLSVDLPSGVDADTGAVPGVAVHADVTLTFGAPKAGMLLYPAAGHVGEVVVADIGLPAPDEAAGSLEVWDWEDLAFLVPIPDPADDKSTRGRVLVVGGSPGLTGAVCLAAHGALRAGAGYVTVAVPASSLQVVEAKLTAPVKTPLPLAGDGGLGPEAVEEVLSLASRADAVVLGPGIGRAESTGAAVRALIERLEVPVLIDADALWALGDDLSRVRGRTTPTVLTPHAGEAARLLGISRQALGEDRPGSARSLAGDGVVCVLKGARTLVAEGDRTAVTMSGGPGLASLGTGDVLAGVIGALLASGMGAYEAAVLGAHLHGAAGDAASDALTAVCCTAEDVLTYLPEAVRSLIEG
jgi:hydroxyethylthiazole kinase-like uncharacterized protein yjeF